MITMLYLLKLERGQCTSGGSVIARWMAASTAGEEFRKMLRRYEGRRAFKVVTIKESEYRDGANRMNCDQTPWNQILKDRKGTE